ncbi:nucleotidyl transferase AbiEii/AbiGii toxin family protein [Clostridium sp.]|uniref:nucleotidyl transferase AbiEii/AbiGii toxin family protein n=1 Tax=Clostridium sp. TaxID=1506 RepID=UPI0026205D42|nr:nucleotidyl transferase AbiEii/AbiGii toxin family protein [Clostridium sp.]
MNLHKSTEEFNELCVPTSEYIGIPNEAVKRDYYIVMILKNLQDSIYCEECVFKGGTSLSKCYPNSINRFSEDIDLTFIPREELSKKQYNKILKKIEEAIIGEANSEKILEERNDRNKSSFVWFEDINSSDSRLKLEIGSSVRPDPYKKRKVKTYIQEYLENINMFDEIREFGLKEVNVNVLCIERTFIDKIFSVKRHALSGTLIKKVRHIYDVNKLYKMKEIQDFIKDKESLRDLIIKTKETDSYYLEKRNIESSYNPLDKYDFNSWNNYFDENIGKRYETLHKDLLYSDEKQEFNEAIETFEAVSNLLNEIGE